MWLSQQQKQAGQERPVDIGPVTLTGETVAVELDSERRGLTVYAPGGYRWLPSVGQKVLVLNTGEGLCVAGALSTERPSKGEVELCSGGAAVSLDGTGKVHLGKDVYVENDLYIDGEELEAMIRRIVVEIVSSMLL